MSNEYINEFLRLKCAPELIEWKIYPNVKEITESMGCYHAVLENIVDKGLAKLNDPTINLISVGDGCTPRTAALFAMRSAWQCWSIDPNMNDKSYNQIKRLYIEKRKIEDGVMNFPGIAIIVCVHSHAKMGDILNHINAPVMHLVTIPCCVPHELDNVQYIGYSDRRIKSEKREVKIWLNVKR